MAVGTLLYGTTGGTAEKAPVRLRTEKIYDDVVKKIEEICGESIYKCFQCGRCAASCPLADRMERPPNHLTRLLQIGDYEALLQSESIWLCASCYACATRCPKGVNLCAIKDAVRQLILRKNKMHLDPRSFSDEVKFRMPEMAAVAAFRKFTA